MKHSADGKWADSARFAFVSQLAALRSCPDVISGLMKSGGSVLLAAKVLVISRLLHTKLAKRTTPPPYLETLRGRLATLRRRLLGRIDRRFKSLDIQREALVEAMCAFALATSSSATDVLRHFHHLRLEAITEQINEAGGKQEYILVALRLYVKTLRDTQGVIPGQLSLALQSLKAMPIFKSPEVYEQMELGLDIHERWIGDDIKTFTPYIRHDDLSRSEADKMLKLWAKSAIQNFLRGLKERIQTVEDPGQLMQLRREVLGLWLSQHQHSLGMDSTEVLDGLRNVFTSHAVLLIGGRTEGLGTVGVLVTDIIRNWQPGNSDALPSLWSPTMTSMETSMGAKAFRQKLMDLSTGKNEALHGVSSKYESWFSGIESIEKVIQEAKSMRWDDDVDDVDDEDELLDNRQILLSEDDPRLLSDALGKDLATAFADLANDLSLTASHLNSSRKGFQAVFLLRVLREMRQHLPLSCSGNDFGREIIHNLLHLVASATLTSPLENCSKRLISLQQRINFPARALWEGDPELPVLPSPWAYRLLIEVVQAMGEHASDVWSPEAVKTIKGEMVVQIAKLLNKVAEYSALRINGHVNGGVSNGEDQSAAAREDAAVNEQTHEDKPAGENESEGFGEDNVASPSKAVINGDSAPNGRHSDLKVEQERKIQLLFDIMYLIDATSVKGHNNGGAGDDQSQSLVRHLHTLMEGLSLDDKTIARMKKNAAEYWKRTGLLFGLLTVQ